MALEARNLPINAGDARDMGSLGREDPLEEEMATHSNILAWKIPWTEEPSRLQSMGGKESDMTEQLTLPQIISPAQIFHQMPPSSSICMTPGTASSTHPE